MQQPPVMLHYATCLLEQRRTPEAVAVLDRLPPDEPASWFDAGVALGRYGAHAEAARFFGAARRNGYTDAYVAGYNQTLMLIDAGDSEAAIGVADELLAQGLKHAELYSLVSRAYANTTRIKEAYDALREATRLEPTVAEHYIDLAMLCLEHENYDLALEIVDIGLKHRPDSSMLYLQRGVVLAMKGAIEQAENEFSRASRASPVDPAPHVALAMVWMQRGQTQKAVEVLRARTRQCDNPTGLRRCCSMRLASRCCAQARRPTRRRVARRWKRSGRPFGYNRRSRRRRRSWASCCSSAATSRRDRAPRAGGGARTTESAPAYVLAQAYRRSGRMDRARSCSHASAG